MKWLSLLCLLFVLACSKKLAQVPENQAPNPNVPSVQRIPTSELVGGGLEGRKIRLRPVYICDSKVPGNVVMLVVVDDSGAVIKATVLPEKSSISDARTLECVVEAAKGFAFVPSSELRQRGTIDLRFRGQ